MKDFQQRHLLADPIRPAERGGTGMQRWRRAVKCCPATERGQAGRAQAAAGAVAVAADARRPLLGLRDELDDS